MNTGSKIKLIREKKRLSQEELAHAVGVTQTTIGNWENGKSIKHEYISKLAEALEVSTDYLLAGKHNNIISNTQEKSNITNGFELTFKAPNDIFEELHKKMDFLITKLDEKK